MLGDSQIGAKLGDESFAKFWGELGGTGRESEAEGGRILFEALGETSAADQFQAKIHVQVRIIGLLLEGEFEEAEVAFAFLAALDQRRIVAVVEQANDPETAFQPPLRAQIFQAFKGLFMHAAHKMHAGRVAKQARDMAAAGLFTTNIHERQTPGDDFRPAEMLA